MQRHLPSSPVFELGWSACQERCRIIEHRLEPLEKEADMISIGKSVMKGNTDRQDTLSEAILVPAKNDHWDGVICLLRKRMAETPKRDPGDRGEIQATEIFLPGFQGGACLGCSDHFPALPDKFIQRGGEVKIAETKRTVIIQQGGSGMHDRIATYFPIRRDAQPEFLDFMTSLCRCVQEGKEEWIPGGFYSTVKVGNPDVREQVPGGICKSGIHPKVTLTLPAGYFDAVIRVHGR